MTHRLTERFTDRPTRRLRGLVATALVAAAGLVGLGAAPASAAWCSGSGVNVVVDFKGLGGGVQKGCDRSGAGRGASRVFPAAGFPLDYVRSQPGFVCRVKGSPSSEPCASTPPADAYWGLYWSDGSSGRWTYSTKGVGSLSVGNGGFVAFSWQNGGANDPPGAAPVNQQPKPTPTPTPTPKPPPKAGPEPTRDPAPAKGPGKGAGDGAGNQSGAGKGAGQDARENGAGDSTAGDRSGGPANPGPAVERATASPRAGQGTRAPAPGRTAGSAGATPSDAASTDSPPEDEPTPRDEPTGEVSSLERSDGSAAGESGAGSGGLPFWVPVSVIAGLAASAGAAGLWRRRRGV